MSNYIGHCRVCQYTLFAEEEQITNGTDWRKLYPGEARRVKLPEHSVALGVYAHCDQYGHKAFRLFEIKGTYNPDHKCDDRCKFAKGNECTCSCGGANHGRGHATIIQAQLPSEPKPDTELRTDKQAKFITTLLEERRLAEDESEDAAKREASYAKLPEISKRSASAWIEKLLTLPKREDTIQI